MRRRASAKTKARSGAGDLKKRLAESLAREKATNAVLQEKESRANRNAHAADGDQRHPPGDQQLTGGYPAGT